MKMKKKYINLVVDAIAYAAFVFLVTTGLLMRYTLPPGSGHRATLWGLNRHAWGDVHFWVSIGFLGVLLIHLFLHWRWIFAVISGKPRLASGSRFLLGATAAIGIILIGLSPFFSDVESSNGVNHLFRRNQFRIDDYDRQVQRQDPHQIAQRPRKKKYKNFNSSNAHPMIDESMKYNEGQKKDSMNIAGYMTLGEIENLSGIPATYILSELKLPPDTPTNEKLGRLKRQYNFEVADVRQAIKNYQMN